MAAAIVNVQRMANAKVPPTRCVAGVTSSTAVASSTTITRRTTGPLTAAGTPNCLALSCADRRLRSLPTDAHTKTPTRRSVATKVKICTTPPHVADALSVTIMQSAARINIRWQL